MIPVFILIWHIYIFLVLLLFFSCRTSPTHVDESVCWDPWNRYSSCHRGNIYAVIKYILYVSI